LKEPDARFPPPAAATGSGAAVNAASPVVGDATPHRRILEDFINAIRTSGRPVCDGAEGRRSVAVVEAIYASARAQGPVTIE
jgi:predicted dehydrogenase